MHKTTTRLMGSLTLSLSLLIATLVANGCGVTDDAELPIDTTLADLALTPDDGLIVGGSRGALLRFDGQDWQREASGTSLDIRSVAASTHGIYFGAGEDYQVGAQDGGVYENTGNGYRLLSKVTDHNSRTSTVRRVLADETGGVWALGDKGAFFHFSHTGQDYALSFGIEGLGIWATDGAVIEDQVYVATSMAGLLRSELSKASLHEIFDHQTNLRWAFELQVERVAGAKKDAVYVAGRDTANSDAPFIGRFDGKTWSVVHQPKLAVGALLVGQGGDVYAAIGGDLLRFDGTSWIRIKTGIPGIIREMAVGADGTLFLLTSSAVFAYDGAGVTELYRVGDPLL